MTSVRPTFEPIWLSFRHRGRGYGSRMDSRAAGRFSRSDSYAARFIARPSEPASSRAPAPRNAPKARGASRQDLAHHSCGHRIADQVATEVAGLAVLDVAAAKFN